MNTEIKNVVRDLEQAIPNLYNPFTEDEVVRIVTDNIDEMKENPVEVFMEAIWDKPMRRCSHCGCLMDEGYYLSGDYACNDACRNELYKSWYFIDTDEEAQRRYLSDSNSDDAEYYWTEWY